VPPWLTVSPGQRRAGPYFRAEPGWGDGASAGRWFAAASTTSNRREGSPEELLEAALSAGWWSRLQTAERIPQLPPRAQAREGAGAARASSKRLISRGRAPDQDRDRSGQDRHPAAPDHFGSTMETLARVVVSPHPGWRAPMPAFGAAYRERRSSGRDRFTTATSISSSASPVWGCPARP